jgi:hypothetical protein
MAVAMLREALTLGIPVIANEYSLQSTSAQAKALGDRLCAEGAVGTGNGRNVSRCGQRKKERWHKKHESEIIVSGVVIATLYAVSRYSLPLTLQANEDNYRIGIKSKGFGLSYSENEILATYRIEF